jgi:carbonic anhydrase
LGDVCLGSVDFAITALSDSVRVIVVLGHSGCGAVAAAVDAYLQPSKYWSKSISPMLRSITQKIFVAVREAANGLREVWGPDAGDMPGYREALVESAVCINAAQAAFALRQEVERDPNRQIEVLYGVYNIRNHQVCMPVDPTAPRADENVRLAIAPSDPNDLQSLAVQMAEILRRRVGSAPSA